MSWCSKYLKLLLRRICLPCLCVEPQHQGAKSDSVWPFPVQPSCPHGASFGSCFCFIFTQPWGEVVIPPWGRAWDSPACLLHTLHGEPWSWHSLCLFPRLLMMGWDFPHAGRAHTIALIISSVEMTKAEGGSQVINVKEESRCLKTPWSFHCVRTYKMCNTTLISQLPREGCLNFWHYLIKNTQGIWTSPFLEFHISNQTGDF